MHVLLALLPRVASLVAAYADRPCMRDDTAICKTAAGLR